MRLTVEQMTQAEDYYSLIERIEEMRVYTNDCAYCLFLRSYYEPSNPPLEAHVVFGFIDKKDIPTLTFELNGKPFDAAFDNLDEALEYLWAAVKQMTSTIKIEL